MTDSQMVLIFSVFIILTAGFGILLIVDILKNRR
jgi:hypothetical protein